MAQGLEPTEEDLGDVEPPPARWSEQDMSVLRRLEAMQDLGGVAGSTKSVLGFVPRCPRSEAPEDMAIHSPTEVAPAPVHGQKATVFGMSPDCSDDDEQEATLLWSGVPRCPASHELEVMRPTDEECPEIPVVSFNFKGFVLKLVIDFFLNE